MLLNLLQQKSDWLVGAVISKEGLKYYIWEHGEPSVMISGVLKMLVSFVDNLDLAVLYKQPVWLALDKELAQFG